MAVTYALNRRRTRDLGAAAVPGTGLALAGGRGQPPQEGGQGLHAPGPASLAPSPGQGPEPKQDCWREVEKVGLFWRCFVATYYHYQ
jgi:hypothetical protein